MKNMAPILAFPVLFLLGCGQNEPAPTNLSPSITPASTPFGNSTPATGQIATLPPATATPPASSMNGQTSTPVGPSTASAAPSPTDLASTQASSITNNSGRWLQVDASNQSGPVSTLNMRAGQTTAIPTTVTLLTIRVNGKSINLDKPGMHVQIDRQENLAVIP